MDKSSEEIRRKKILDNAEARLRFIKEGVPWRQEEEKNETPTQNEPDKSKVETSSKESLNQIDDSSKSLPPAPVPQSSSQNSEDVETEKVENIVEVNHSENVTSENNDIMNLNSFIAAEACLNSLKLRLEESGNNILRQRDPPLLFSQSSRERGLPSSTGLDSQTDTTLRTLRALLKDSSNERQDHKRKADQLNRNLWMSCFLMLCLGIFTRLAYSMQLSWLFNEVMLVPFATGAVPVLVALARDPPAPTGAIVQILLMAGVKTSVLRRAFTAITVLRTFLQLFSVYLISFVVTHQMATSN